MKAWIGRLWGARGRVVRSRSAVAIATSSTLVVTTALMALVVEDLLPHQPNEPTIDFSNFTGWRLGFAAAGVALLIFLSRVVSRLRRSNGTLYYLRILDERAPDLHAEANLHSRRKSLDYRSVTRSLDLGTDRSVDIASIVSDARADLERAAASDDTSSSFEFAPNAHWPIEFALGYEWPLPDDALLIELDRANPKPGFSVSSNPGRPGSIAAAVRDDTTRLVHVDVHLSLGSPLSMDNLAELDRDLFGRTADETIAVGWSDGRMAEGEARRGVRIGDEGLPAQAAADLIARTVLEALDRHSRASIVISVNTTKAVGVLAGRYFAAYLQEQNSGAQSRHWTSPWRRMFLVARNITNFHSGEARRAQIMRVHRNQRVDPPWWKPVPQDGVIVNLTPHDLVVYAGDRVVLSVPRSGETARIAEVRDEPCLMVLNNCETEVVDLSYADYVTGLPDPVDGTWYVVSRITAQSMRDREDLLFPLDEVRNEAAQIIGCRALGRFSDQANA